MGECLCLRCKTIPLRVVGPRDPRATFFECPGCGRHYTLLPGKELTFRWPHPIGLALYDVQFDEAPARHAAEAADLFVKGRSIEQLESLVTEIRLELQQPTQQVRDILGCRASEDDVREFLRLFGERASEYSAGRTHN